MGNLPTVAICVPGANWGRRWLIGYTDLVMQLIANGFGTLIVYPTGSNLYDVRNLAVELVTHHSLEPDYVLWIDSDNPPSFHNFMELFKDNRDIVAGWYYVTKDEGEAPSLSYGENGIPFITPPVDAPLIELENGYTGFGFVLMRYSVLRALGLDAFGCTYKGIRVPDDLGFCIRAQDAGFKIHINSEVKLEHMKLQPIKTPAMVQVQTMKGGIS